MDRITTTNMILGLVTAAAILYLTFGNSNPKLMTVASLAIVASCFVFFGFKGEKK